jgi:hypothetical protein
MMTIPPYVFSRPAVATLPATAAPMLGPRQAPLLAPIAAYGALPFIYTKPAVDNEAVDKEMTVTWAKVAIRVAPGIASLSLRAQG